VNVSFVALSLTSSMPKKNPSPRTPTIDRSSSFSRVARKTGDCRHTCALRPSRSTMSRFAMPTAAETGCPPNV
jgi:hypothetical protein